MTGSTKGNMPNALVSYSRELRLSRTVEEGYLIIVKGMKREIQGLD